MGTWTTLQDKATFRVKEYDITASPKILTLTMMFDGVEAEEFTWDGSWRDDQRKFGKAFCGLTRDAFQVALDRGAPTKILAETNLVTMEDSSVEIEETYLLDYLMADGIMIPQVTAIWNPYRDDADEEVEDLYHYQSIDLHYRWEEDPPKYTLTNVREILTDPYERKHYGGHDYMMPDYDPEEMSDGTTTVYHQLHGDDIGGYFEDEEGYHYFVHWVHPGILGYLQQIPLDLLEQFYYHGGWPAEILNCNIWTLFNGSTSHPNYTDPPVVHPTSCFHNGSHEERVYLAVADCVADQACISAAEQTYATACDLWKRAFWWNYIISQHDPPMGLVQSGGYTGAGYALLQYTGKALPDLPIVYEGKSLVYSSIIPLLGGLFLLGASFLVNSTGVGRRRKKR